jgi:hypothetical protein
MSVDELELVKFGHTCVRLDYRHASLHTSFKIKQMKSAWIGLMKLAMKLSHYDYYCIVEG